MNLKVISFNIVCRDYDTDSIANEFYKSHIAQMGIYTLGHNERDLTEDEQDEVTGSVPDDILEDAEEI